MAHASFRTVSSGSAEEAAAEAAKVVERKNYARKTVSKPSCCKQLAGLSLIDVDKQGNSGPPTVVGTGPEADMHHAVKSFDKPPFMLPWPEDDIEEISDTFENDPDLVYGAGRYMDGMFIISCRYKKNRKTEVDERAIEVPTLYGFHLEHLCYQLRCSQISWRWASEEFVVDGEVVACYQTSLEAIGRTWLYHRNALKAVAREIHDLGDEVHTPQARIKSLDEWVIRQRFGLAFAEEDELQEAHRKGLFKMDILHDAANLSS